MKINEIFLEKTTSTQDYAKEHKESFDNKAITFVIAKEQTAGRGRFQRKWVSPKGNLYVTIYLQLPSSTCHLVSMGQIVSLSLAKLFIKENFCPKIKWPNDILVDGKKIAGILCETEMKDGVADLFVGFGVNVNMNSDQIEEVNQPATSLMIVTGRRWDKTDLLHDFQEQFLKDLDIFLKEGFTPFHCQFENLMAFKGEKITCFDGKKEWKGICHSLTNDGQLNLYLDNGDIKTLSSGEIHCK